MTTATKEEKINIRVHPTMKAILVRAASLSHTSLTDFVLQPALERAQRVLSEQTDFPLPKDQWKAFCKALDAPPKDNPNLGLLLTEPGVFDG